MEQKKQEQNPGSFSKRIGTTLYQVNVFFDESAVKSVEDKLVEPKTEVVRGNSYLEDERIFADLKPIEKAMVFYEEQPKWDEDVQEHEEIPKYKESSEIHDIALLVQELECENDIQSNEPEQAKMELVAYTEPLPDRFADYSLLSVTSKAKYFEFDITDNNYNLNLYKAVMRKMNQKMSSSELFEGYQEIYETKMMNRVATLSA